MEITLAAGDFATAIGLVKGVVPSRTTFPILSNVMIDTSSGKLCITGTCLDMEASIFEPAEIITHGKITVPGHVLFGLVKSLPKTKLVTLKIKDGSDRVVLTCGKSVYELGALPVDDFPIMEGVSGEGEVSITIAASVLKSALAATRNCASDEETRYYLKGVHVTQEDSRLTFVATDGFRLVRIVTDVVQSSEMPHVIIPSDAVQNILSIIDGIAGDVTMTMDGLKIEVVAGSVRLVSRLIAGTYPDYGRVIPRYNSDPSFTAKSSDMADAIGRLSTIVMGNVKINPAAKIATNGTAIDVSLRGMNQGTETIDAEIGSKTEFGASVKFLSEMIGLWPSSAILKFTAPDARSPILIMSDDAPHQTQVIMPMKV